MKKIPFLVQLLIALVGIALLIVGVAYFLDTYTNHGKTAKVPRVQGKNVKDAIKIIEDAGFDYSVDSTYRDSLPAHYVIKQYPYDGDMVKAGRTIQLIVNKGVPPQVAMPSLVGVKMSSAFQYIERNNLKLGDTIFKPDFAIGRVLRQMINGKDVLPGTMISYGTKVTLVISGGLGNTIYNYPDLYGKTLEEAYKILDTLGLSRGALSVDPGVSDTLRSLIYKQYPEPWDYFDNKPTLIRQGNTVDLFIASKLKPREVDTTKILVNDEEFDNAARAEEEQLEYESANINDPKNQKKKKKVKAKPKAEANKPNDAPKPSTGLEYE
jgi:eukaryotic-like serine/threonine-protein kinase